MNIIKQMVTELTQNRFIVNKNKNLRGSYMNKELQTNAGIITTRYYDDGIAKGVEILLNGDIVCMFDVMQHTTEGGARLIVYSDYSEDEPTDIIDINKGFIN